MPTNERSAVSAARQKGGVRRKAGEKAAAHVNRGPQQAQLASSIRVLAGWRGMDLPLRPWLPRRRKDWNASPPPPPCCATIVAARASISASSAASSSRCSKPTGAPRAGAGASALSPSPPLRSSMLCLHNGGKLRRHSQRQRSAQRVRSRRSLLGTHMPPMPPHASRLHLPQLHRRHVAKQSERRLLPPARCS